MITTITVLYPQDGVYPEIVSTRWTRKITKIARTMLIGKSEVLGTRGSIRAFNPAADIHLDPSFGVGGEEDVDRACTLAEQSFDSFRETSLAERARFLRRIGQGVLNLGDALIDRAQAETGLPKGRLERERGRTVVQLAVRVLITVLLHSSAEFRDYRSRNARLLII